MSYEVNYTANAIADGNKIVLIKEHGEPEGLFPEEITISFSDEFMRYEVAATNCYATTYGAEVKSEVSGKFRFCPHIAWDNFLKFSITAYLYAYVTNIHLYETFDLSITIADDFTSAIELMMADVASREF